jgi:hypothetical protein
MDEELKRSLTASDSWLRGLYMVLFAFIFQLVEIVLVFVVIFQFLYRLVTREVNDQALDLGDDLSIYAYHVLQYVTYNSDEKPYPFAPWPHGSGAPDEAGSASDTVESEEDPVLISEEDPHLKDD